MKKRKCLVIGSGAREHALVHILALRDGIEMHAAPGNPGMERYAQCHNVAVHDVENLVKFAREKEIDLTIVGPEVPLVKYGIADAFRACGFKIIGPSQAAARIEGSKIFCKEFLQEFGVPTAPFQVFDNPKDAALYIGCRPADKMKCVVKADGLAAGKGVRIVHNFHEGNQAVKELMEDKIYGDAGSRIVVEDFLEGHELSVLVLADSKGDPCLLFPGSQDYKELYPGGPMTGGMGAWAPKRYDRQYVMDRIIRPTLEGMKARGCPFQGFLYGGLMVAKDGIFVLEFNCRPPDPEWEAIALSLGDCGFFDHLLDSAHGTLSFSHLEAEWCSVGAVIAARGYPDKPETGLEISGIEKAEQKEKVVVYHAGTKRMADGKLVNSGGRVLFVGAYGTTFSEARESMKRAAQDIRLGPELECKIVRSDIGLDAV